MKTLNIRQMGIAGRRKQRQPKNIGKNLYIEVGIKMESQSIEICSLVENLD